MTDDADAIVRKIRKAKTDPEPAAGAGGRQRRRAGDAGGRRRAAPKPSTSCASSQRWPTGRSPRCSASSRARVSAASSRRSPRLAVEQLGAINAEMRRLLERSGGDRPGAGRRRGEGARHRRPDSRGNLPDCRFPEGPDRRRSGCIVRCQRALLSPPASPISWQWPAEQTRCLTTFPTGRSPASERRSGQAGSGGCSGGPSGAGPAQRARRTGRPRRRAVCAGASPAGRSGACSRSSCSIIRSAWPSCTGSGTTPK